MVAVYPLNFPPTSQVLSVSCFMICDFCVSNAG